MVRSQRIHPSNLYAVCFTVFSLHEPMRIGARAPSEILQQNELLGDESREQPSVAIIPHWLQDSDVSRVINRFGPLLDRTSSDCSSQDPSEKSMHPDGSFNSGCDRTQDRFQTTFQKQARSDDPQISPGAPTILSQVGDIFTCRSASHCTRTALRT